MNEEEKVCPVCGSKEIGEGVFSGGAAMKPILSPFGTAVIADVCTDCGHILSMRAENPQKFK